MRRQILDTSQLKKPIIFDTELIGKFIVQQDKMSFVNNNTLQVNCGKNTSNEVNIACDQAIQILNLQPLVDELDVNIYEVKSNIKSFV